MNILSIETSCDETAVALLECAGDPRSDSAADAFSFKVLGNALHSQVKMHEEFGGVVPMLAKREHAKNLIPLFKQVVKTAFPPDTLSPQFPVFKSAQILGNKEKSYTEERLTPIFGRETEFKAEFMKLLETLPKLPIHAIAVTEGPGLEPALWMGIIFAKALADVLDIPLIPVNHMEGHILSVLPQKIGFPALALLISGGHTELVLMKEWGRYEVIGQTRDDAVGEAFDKVARMLDLPYPGGPEISRLAELARKTQTSTPEYILPRPMIHSKDYDFSFSGIKTAVLYSLKQDLTTIPMVKKEVVAREFEDAVTEVLVAKTFRAVEEYGIRTLIIGGGVVANEHIRKEFEKKAAKYTDFELLLPDKELRTDNALMIGLAGYVKWIDKKEQRADISARGNLSFV